MPKSPKSLTIRGYLPSFHPIAADLEPLSPAGRMDYLVALAMQWKGAERVTANGGRIAPSADQIQIPPAAGGVATLPAPQAVAVAPVPAPAPVAAPAADPFRMSAALAALPLERFDTT